MRANTTLGEAPHPSSSAGALLEHTKTVGRFAWHALEMCVAMCVGGGLLSVTFFASAAALGYPRLWEREPAASTLVVAVSLAIAMVVWMRFRRMAWRPTLEMAASSVLTGVAVVAAYAVNIVDDSVLVAGVCGPACLVMVLVMLPRYQLYARHGHH
jgi:hypothetical protein